MDGNIASKNIKQLPSGQCRTSTLPETNIAPENGWLDVFFPLRNGLFSGAMLVVGSDIHEWTTWTIISGA